MAKSTGSKSLVRRLGRAALIVLGVLALGLVGWHLSWKYSGTGEWQLEIDRDGIQIYSLKRPGELLKDFKCVRRIKSSLNQIATAMADTSVEHCLDWNPACTGAKTIVPWSADNTSITLYDLQLKPPFQNRDIVFKQTISQDPQTKVLTVDLVALSGVVPERPGYVRVTKIHNVWRWTPLEGGEVQLELVDSMDPQLPYFLVNQKAKWLHTLMSRVPELIAREQYRGKQFPSVQEPQA